MIRALTLTLIVSLGAHAADPADAPRAVVLAPGQSAPSRGLFKPEAMAIRDEQDHERLKAENDALKVALVIVGVVAAGAGAAIGVAVSEAGKRP